MMRQCSKNGGVTATPPTQLIGRLGVLLFLLLPATARAAATDNEKAREQAMLVLSKALEITGIWSLVAAIVIFLLLYFLMSVLGARICFGSDSVWSKTFKYYVYLVGLTLASYILFGVIGLVGISILQSPGATLFFLAIVSIGFWIYMYFLMPMSLFDAGFLRVLGFNILVYFIGSALLFALAFASMPLLLTDEKKEQYKRLAKDMETLSVKAETDYSKSTTTTDFESDERLEAEKPAADPRQQLAAEAAALTAEFAGLKTQFAALDKSDKAAVAAYNTAYAEYTRKLQAYNAKVKAMAPAATPAATPR